MLPDPERAPRTSPGRALHSWSPMASRQTQSRLKSGATCAASSQSFGVSRRGRPPKASEILALLEPIAARLRDAADDDLLDALRDAGDLAERPTGLLRGVPGLLACSATRRCRRPSPSTSRPSARSCPRRATPRPLGDLADRRPRNAQRLLGPRQGRDVGDRARPAAHRACRPRPRRPRRLEARAARGLPVGAAGAGRDRSARGSRARYRRTLALLFGTRSTLASVGVAPSSTLGAATRSSATAQCAAATASSSFVYKAAAEIGELGDNTTVLRAMVDGDGLLRAALAADTAKAVVLGHTRWASVGIVSEANAHPLNGEQVGGGDEPYVVAALNGDVDNYADLIATEALRIQTEITTDAKVIPSLMRPSPGQRCATDRRVPQHRRRRSRARSRSPRALPTPLTASSSRCEAAAKRSTLGWPMTRSSSPPSPTAWSKTPRSIYAWTARHPEIPTIPRRVAARSSSSTLRAPVLSRGSREQAYDGTLLPVTVDELVTAPITTRDIDRGDFPHFLLKEITESPSSFRKTLRGKLLERDGVMEVVLGPETISDELKIRLASHKITRIIVTGQGTAAVAGNAVALGDRIRAGQRLVGASHFDAGDRALRVSHCGPTWSTRSSWP